MSPRTEAGKRLRELVADSPVATTTFADIEQYLDTLAADFLAARDAEPYVLLVSSIPALYRSWRNSPNDTAAWLNRVLLDRTIEWVQGYQRSQGREPDDYTEYDA